MRPRALDGRLKVHLGVCKIVSNFGRLGEAIALSCVSEYMAAPRDVSRKVSKRKSIEMR